MRIVAVSVFLAMALSRLDRRPCSIPESKRGTLNILLQSMLYSINSDNLEPNPSVLIALRLARDHHLEKERELLHQLKETAVQKVKRKEPFSSGLVALYTMAFTASCLNPEHVETDQGSVNLLDVLSDKLDKEIEHIETQSVPVSNYYQVGLDILSLCVHHRPVSERILRHLIEAVEGERFTHGSDFSVDTGSVCASALHCVRDADQSLLVPSLPQALKTLLDKILSNVRPDGLIGNEYSTGLAVQALSVNQDRVRPGSWNCSRTLGRLLERSEESEDGGAFSNPQAASQMTPSLEGRTYLDVGTIDCRQDLSNLTLPIRPSPSPPPTQSPLIQVWVNVTDGVGRSFTDIITVSIPRGSSLLQTMEAAREKAPLRFSFQTQTSLWGPFLTSVRGVESSQENRTYWQLRNGSQPLEQGLGDYKPNDGELVIIILSQY